MSGLRIILLEKFNTPKNIYLNDTPTCQGLTQGHLSSSHIFESKKITALNVLVIQILHKFRLAFDPLQLVHFLTVVH